MSKEAGWVGTAVGVSAGILVWVVGLHNALWPAHPRWVLAAVICGVAALSSIVIERRGPDEA